MSILKTIFFIIFIYSFGNSNEYIKVSLNDKNQEILSKSDILIDNSNSLTINDIKTKSFKSNNLKRLSYGYSPDFTVWIRFRLKNITDKKISKILEYGNPITTNIEFYDNNNSFKDGLFQLNFSKESINPRFNIELKPNETKTYYLKANSKVTTLIIRLNIIDKKQFIENSFNHKMILAMFFAVMAILAIYNFFIFFFTKDKNYLFYVLYILGVINHQLFYTGFGNIYIFNQEISTKGVLYAEFYVAFTIFMFALLVRSFLNLKQYKKLYLFYNIYLVLFPFIVLIIWYFEIFNIRNLFSFILLIITSLILFYAIYKKNRQAYFVGLGWILFALSVGFMYLSSIGTIYIFDDFKYFVEIGLVLEIIIFSIALADKINQLEKKKNEANIELILNQQSEKSRLENQIKKQTKELTQAYEEKNLLLKELNHRIKNNMQTIISLIRLQIDEIDDKKTKEILETIKNRINAMSGVHELLYNQNDTTYINAYEYLENLIDELKESFQTNNIKINFKITTKIKVEQAIYCGLIVNELITNSFKYAFPNHKGKINITLIKSKNRYNLTICDNGIGYNSDNSQENLGLKLIDTLVKIQLKGSIEINSENGVKVVIIWD